MSLLLAAGSGATTYTYTASGGIVTGGAAALSKTKDSPVSGGAVAAGSAALSKTKDYPVAGGATTSGTATLSKTKHYIASGGAISGGTAQSSFEAAAIGGPVFRRAIVLRRPPSVFTYRPRGGISAGGAAETSLERAPARVYAFEGRARRRLRGQASVEYFDMGDYIRRLDDELLLLAA